MNVDDKVIRTPDAENLDGFASRLYLARNAVPLTQEALAERAGIPGGGTTIAHYEARRREPNLENLRRLVRALDCGADYLLATRSGVDDDYGRTDPAAPTDAADSMPVDDKYATQQRFDGQRASVGRVVVVAQLVHDEQGRSTWRTEIVAGSIASIRYDLPVFNTEKGDVYEPYKDENGKACGGLEFMPCSTERDVETMPAGSWTWPVRV